MQQVTIRSNWIATFACYDASCRPPTSGGTGGSKKAARPTVSGFKVGDKYRDKTHGDVEVTEVRRAVNNKGVQNYDMVKVTKSDGSRMMIPVHAGSASGRKVNPPAARKKAYDPMHDDDGYDAMKDRGLEQGTWTYRPGGKFKRTYPGRPF